MFAIVATLWLIINPGAYIVSYWWRSTDQVISLMTFNTFGEKTPIAGYITYTSKRTDIDKVASIFQHSNEVIDAENNRAVLCQEPAVPCPPASEWTRFHPSGLP